MRTMENISYDKLKTIQRKNEKIQVTGKSHPSGSDWHRTHYDYIINPSSYLQEDHSISIQHLYLKTYTKHSCAQTLLHPTGLGA